VPLFFREGAPAEIARGMRCRPTTLSGFGLTPWLGGERPLQPSACAG